MGRRRPLPIEGGANSLGGAEGAADLSDAALGVGAFMETCTVAGDEFVSAGADMAAGKLGRQFPNIREGTACRYSGWYMYDTLLTLL